MTNGRKKLSSFILLLALSCAHTKSEETNVKKADDSFTRSWKALTVGANHSLFPYFTQKGVYYSNLENSTHRLVKIEDNQPELVSTGSFDESMPVVNSNKNLLAFVSKKEDALGDIYLRKLGLSFTKDRQISLKGERDYAPHLSADGKLLTYTSHNNQHDTNIRIYDIERKSHLEYKIPG